MNAEEQSIANISCMAYLTGGLHLEDWGKLLMIQEFIEVIVLLHLTYTYTARSPITGPGKPTFPRRPSPERCFCCLMVLSSSASHLTLNLKSLPSLACGSLERMNV